MVQVVVIQIEWVVEDACGNALWPISPAYVFGGGYPGFGAIEYDVVSGEFLVVTIIFGGLVGEGGEFGEVVGIGNTVALGAVAVLCFSGVSKCFGGAGHITYI